jgi:hypothetical protein
MLTVPFVALVLLSTIVIGLLSHTAGRDAVDTLSGYLLHETVARIAQAVDKHISSAEGVLETAFPEDLPPQQSIQQDLDTLRTQLWLATSIHMDPNNYPYYCNRHGHFIGLWRFSQIDGALKEPVQEIHVFDPRLRPWYQTGQSASGQTWTPIYVDFKSLELVVTRARRVNNMAGEFEGVVATDVSLRSLNTFLKNLTLSPNGIAIIVEADGKLVATLRGPHLHQGAQNDNTHIDAASSEDPLIAATYRAVLERKLRTMSRKAQQEAPHSLVQTAPSCMPPTCGYATMPAWTGLDCCGRDPAQRFHARAHRQRAAYCMDGLAHRHIRFWGVECDRRRPATFGSNSPGNWIRHSRCKNRRGSR